MSLIINNDSINECTILVYGQPCTIVELQDFSTLTEGIIITLEEGMFIIPTPSINKAMEILIDNNKLSHLSDGSNLPELQCSNEDIYDDHGAMKEPTNYFGPMSNGDYYIGSIFWRELDESILILNDEEFVTHLKTVELYNEGN